MTLLERLREQLRTAHEERQTIQTEVDELLAAPTAEGRDEAARGDFTDEERTRYEEASADLVVRDADIDQLQARVDDMTRQEERSATAASSRASLGNGDRDPAQPRRGSAGHEFMYHRGSEFRYFNDLARAVIGIDPFAGARLAIHGQEMERYAADNPNTLAARSLRDLQGRTGLEGLTPEQRAGLTTTVGSGGTFLPPEYLLDLWIKFPRQARVLADLVQKMDLPRGPMTIDIPKITTGTSTSAQGTQNTSATEVDLTDAYVSATVNTVAGQQTVSLQLVEQSAVPYDEIVFSDLSASLDQTTEQYVAQGTGTSGQYTGVVNVSGVNSISYTSGSPSGVGLYPYLAQAKAEVFDAIKRPADAFVMYPDRWAWLEVATDGNNRPLVVPADRGPFNTIGSTTDQMENSPTPVGRLFGVPVYVTSEIPTDLGSSTNQDEIIALSTKDLILWESAPVARALPQTLGNQLSILLQVYRYGAFMPNRLPGAITLLGGTGLATPSF